MAALKLSLDAPQVLDAIDRKGSFAAAAAELHRVPSALSYGVHDGIRSADRPILDFVDHMVSDFVLPLGGLLIALFVGWRVERALALADVGLTGSRLGALWLWSLRVLAPLTIAALLLRALFGT